MHIVNIKSLPGPDIYTSVNSIEQESCKSTVKNEYIQRCKEFEEKLEDVKRIFPSKIVIKRNSTIKQGKNEPEFISDNNELRKIIKGSYGAFV